MSLSPLSVVDSNEYLHPYEKELATMLSTVPARAKEAAPRRVNWIKDCTLPKALFLLAATKPPKGSDTDRAFAPYAIFREIIESKLHKTHNIRINFIHPDKTANELWRLLERITETEKPELIVIGAHGMPTSMHLTNHAKQGMLSSEYNPFAKSVLSQLPACDIILSSCSTGRGSKENQQNMRKFFADHALHIRVHAPENDTIGFKWNDLHRTIEWKYQEKKDTKLIEQLQNNLILVRKPILEGATNKELRELYNKPSNTLVKTSVEKISKLVASLRSGILKLGKLFTGKEANKELKKPSLREIEETSRTESAFNLMREMILKGLTDEEIVKKWFPKNQL